MKWIKGAPTKAGWNWIKLHTTMGKYLKEKPRSFIAEIKRFNSSGDIITSDSEYYSANDILAHAPIEEPEE